jgi:hypothetical protein
MLGRLALLIFMLVGFIVAAAILTAGTAALLKAVGLRGEPFFAGGCRRHAGQHGLAQAQALIGGIRMATHAKYAVARVEAARRSSPRGFMKQRGVGDAMRVASFSIPKDTYERLQVIHRKLNTGPYFATLGAILDRALKAELDRIEEQLSGKGSGGRPTLHPVLKADDAPNAE